MSAQITVTPLLLASIILLGVPHGALDVEIARPLLRPRYGGWWFAVFALPYLGLAALVLLAWRVAPLPVLMVFLAASAVHFGAEDAGPHAVPAIARGGLPIAVPVLVHPAATAKLFGTISLVTMNSAPEWLSIAAWSWCGFAGFWAMQAVRRRSWRALGEAGGLIVLFCATTPLAGFAVYFVAMHAPRHMAALVRDPRAPRVRSLREAIMRALPVTGLTIAIGAALWPYFPGAPAPRLLTLTMQCLAALTLPHMLLGAFAPETGGRDRALQGGAGCPKSGHLAIDHGIALPQHSAGPRQIA